MVSTYVDWPPVSTLVDGPAFLPVRRLALPAALLPYQLAEMTDHFGKELADDRLVDWIHEAERVPPLRPGQRDVVLADLAALAGHEQPDHAPVPLVAAPLDVSLPDQRVHHRGQRAGRRPAPRRDVAGLEPVPGHQHPQHAQPGRTDPEPGLGQGARVERAHDPGCGQQQHVQRRVRRRNRVTLGRLAPDPARLPSLRPALCRRGLTGPGFTGPSGFRLVHAASFTQSYFHVKSFDLKVSAP